MKLRKLKLWGLSFVQASSEALGVPLAVHISHYFLKEDPLNYTRFRFHKPWDLKGSFSPCHSTPCSILPKSLPCTEGKWALSEASSETEVTFAEKAAQGLPSP